MPTSKNNNDIKKISNNQKKKQKAAAHNAANEIAENMLLIGECGKCHSHLFMYLKSNPENICNYYCMGCDHKGTVKDIDKSDGFYFPMVNIIGEVSRHYDKESFDKAYNS